MPESPFRLSIIDYLNAGRPRDQVKIAGFEFFGHSNRACFMFDYSNEVDSASKSWLCWVMLALRPPLLALRAFWPRRWIG